MGCASVPIQDMYNVFFQLSGPRCYFCCVAISGQTVQAIGNQVSSNQAHSINTRSFVLRRVEGTSRGFGNKDTGAQVSLSHTDSMIILRLVSRHVEWSSRGDFVSGAPRWCLHTCVCLVTPSSIARHDM